MDRKLIVEIRTRLAKAKPGSLSIQAFAAELAERYDAPAKDLKSIIRDEAGAKGVKLTSRSATA
jgi:hypothetical protein